MVSLRAKSDKFLGREMFGKINSSHFQIFEKELVSSFLFSPCISERL
jgi:hypothetical protein